VILVISVIALVFVVGKELFTKDEVEVDSQFEAKKLESKQEAQKELEDLE
jgi:hypothetical protein